MKDKTETIHDYALSIDELCSRSNTSTSIVNTFERVSFNLVQKELEKANYFAYLFILKNSFKHPYDSTIYRAEELASKDEFVAATSLLLGLVFEYGRK